MLSVFDILVKVTCSHSYFYNGVFNGYAIQPSADTARLLTRYDMIFKTFNGGFYILYDQKGTGTTRTREDILKENLVLNFNLTLTDSLFYNYTADAPAQVDQSVYYFNNILNKNGSLYADEYVSEKDMQPVTYFNEQYFIKPFAKLSLAADKTLQTEYTIKFKARSTYWRYILTSTYLQELSSPAILDASSANAFGVPEKINLPGNRQVNAFTSGQALQLCQRPASAFQLAENYEAGSSRHRVVIRSLPYPDISNISRLTNTNSSNFSDIFI